MQQRSTRLQKLKELERAELDAATEEWARRELRPHGLPEWVGAQLRLWKSRLDGLASWVQLLIKLTPVVSVLGSGYKLVRFMWVRHAVKPPEERGTGIASTALDRVEKPRAVDGAVQPPRRR